MTIRSRPARAVISPAAAYFIHQALGAQIEAMGRGRCAHRGQEWLGTELLDAVAELEARGAEWFASMKVDPDAEPAEHSVGRELTPAQASELTGFGVRGITKQAGEAIEARQLPNGRWLLEEWSVLEYAAARRSRASSGSDGGDLGTAG